MIRKLFKYFFQDNCNATYWFDNGWHCNSNHESFKCKQRLTNDEVIAHAKTLHGWRLSSVRRNGETIFG